MLFLAGDLASNVSSVGENRQINSDFGICGAQRATKMAMGNHSHIDFASNTELFSLGDLGYIPDVRRLEL